MGGMTTFKVPTTISWSLSLSGEWISWNWPGREVSIKSNIFFSRVGKCTSCPKPWSFLMSINICPSDWLNAEPDLLSLSGQSISLKLKSPKMWTEGSFFTFMLVPDMVKLIPEQLKVFTYTTRLLISTSHIMRSFICKYFDPNWFRVVFQFLDGHMWNILVNKQYHTTAMKVSVFPVHIIWTRLREQFWNCNGGVNFVSWIATTWGRWKSRKANNSSVLPQILLMFMLTNFSPLIKLFLLVQNEENSFLFFCQGIRKSYTFSECSRGARPRPISYWYSIICCCHWWWRNKHKSQASYI